MNRIMQSICAAVLTVLSAGAAAQDYPTKPIRMIMPNAPGSANDTLGRIVAAHLGEALGAQIVIDNRAGAGGLLGMEIAKNGAPDGYTLAAASTAAMSIAPHIYKKLPYDPIKDFAAVAYVGYVPNVLAVNPSVPAKSVKELVALLKSKPGQFNYASSGNGSTQHLAGELFKQLTGTDIVHVPYKGSGDAIKDLLAGVVAMNFDTMPPVLPHIQAGKLRGLAISTPQRVAQLPDVPTFAEEGITGFDVTNWYGVMAPAGTPRDIVQKMNTDINKAMQVPEVRARLESVGTQMREESIAEFDAYMKSEVAKYAKLIKETGVRID
jgi:tripartite-type tricarboxylate transporter receptor subunit TctC